MFLSTIETGQNFPLYIYAMYLTKEIFIHPQNQLSSPKIKQQPEMSLSIFANPNSFYPHSTRAVVIDKL